MGNFDEYLKGKAFSVEIPVICMLTLGIIDDESKP